MSSTLGNNYVGPVGPNGVQVWRPTVFPTGAIQSGSQPATGSGGTSPSQGSGGGNNSGGTDSSGNVYASALFFNATCQSGDAVGNAVRADTNISAVISVSCYQPYPAIGVIVSKSDDTHCVVQTYGLCSGIYSGLTANDRYFVGNSSQPSLGTSLPSDGAYVQAIGFAVQPGVLFIQPTGVILRRFVGSGVPPAPSGQQSGASAPGDTVRFAGGRILHGTGQPDPSLGYEDDTYLQTDGPSGYVLWGPKDSNGWGSSGLALVGPQGPVGPAGQNGADSTVPGPVGPQGPAGADSTVAGPPGPAGPVGAAGKDGADSTVPGPQGPAGADSTVPGPQGPVGPAGQDSTVPGPAGPQGQAGQNGTLWFDGDGPPDPNNTYPDGSYYYDRTGKEIYPPAA